jgi:anthranilate phosphoribosyltransferase
LVTLVDPFDGYLRTLSVSAFIPAVLAACGFSCVIHGVEALGPKFGVTVRQVLSMHPSFELGFNRTKQRLESSGWAYVDQQDYLPELYQLVPLRNTVIKRTAITTFERVLAPVRSSGTNHLAVGYVHKAYPDMYAAIAQQAGFDFIHLHKGVEGGLMVAPNKPFARYSADLRNPEIHLTKSSHSIDKHALVLPKLAQGIHSKERALICYEQGVSALGGQIGPCRDSLIAACANVISSLVSNLDYLQAVEKARQQIDNGSALDCFNSALSD